MWLAACIVLFGLLTWMVATLLFYRADEERDRDWFLALLMGMTVGLVWPLAWLGGFMYLVVRQVNRKLDEMEEDGDDDLTY